MHVSAEPIRFRLIQQMLGHDDLKTTQIYTQVSIRQLKQIHSATHTRPTSRNRKQSPQPTMPPRPNCSPL